MGDKIKQIGAICLEKLVQWNHNIILLTNICDFFESLKYYLRM